MAQKAVALWCFEIPAGMIVMKSKGMDMERMSSMMKSMMG
jgi:hypothetical protein